MSTHSKTPTSVGEGLVFSARFVTVKGCEIIHLVTKGTPSMAQWVSFDEVKSRVSMKDVLAHYSLMQGVMEKPSKRGLELRLRCPFHEDKTPSLSISAETGKFHCFGCHAKGGDIFDFVVTKEGISGEDRTKNRRRAALLIADWFGVERSAAGAPPPSPAAESSAPVQDATPAREEPEAGTNPPLKFTFKHLDTRHSYLTQERGLKEATIDAFGLGYHAGKGIMHDRVVIPIHNERGELVAYAGRSLGDPPEGSGKYAFPPNFKKSLVLFNLHRAREHATDGLIVVEGFFTVFEFFQRGRRNVVALMGSSMSKEQEQLIVETVGPKGRVLLALDNDEAGRKGSADALTWLSSQVFVREMAL
jgi:DNA primase